MNKTQEQIISDIWRYVELTGRKEDSHYNILISEGNALLQKPTGEKILLLMEYCKSKGYRQGLRDARLQAASARNLYDLRIKGGYSVEDVATACNITPLALEAYESGTRTPRDSVKIRLADFYHSRVQDIFF